MKTSPLDIAVARSTTGWRYRTSFALSALSLPALMIISGASSAATAYLGWVTDSTTDPYVNRCAIDPVSSISTLPTNPNYVMAYRSGSDSCSSFAPTTGNGMIHRQGIQRLTRGGLNYLLVTMSTNNGTHPGFEVIRLGSRTGTTGLLGGNVTPLQYPSCADAVTRYQADDSTRDHAGGFHISGEYAVVPLESSNDSTGAGFRTAQLSVPSTPSWSPMVLRQRSQTTNAGAAGMTRLSSGNFMTLVFGNNSDDVEVFVSSSTSLPGHNGSTSTWISMASANTPFGGGNYQGLQLITKCDGQLFVAGTHKDVSTDWVDLWRVDLNASYVPTFTKVANRHMYCSTSNTGNTRYCDFQAGAGIYVNGSGGLHLYGVEHYNDGVSGTTRVVKVREF
jgi:hypothetical protein